MPGAFSSFEPAHACPHAPARGECPCRIFPLITGVRTMAVATFRCPSAEELERFLGEELADADRTVIETHVETCASCQERLERLLTPTNPLFRAPAISP